MFWDDLIRRWRRGPEVTDRTMLRAAGGHVAALPSPRQHRRVRIPWWLLVTVIAALAWLFLNATTAHAAFV